MEHVGLSKTYTGGGNKAALPLSVFPECVQHSVVHGWNNLPFKAGWSRGWDQMWRGQG